MALSILCIEDNPMDTQLVRRIVTPMGYQLLEASDGNSGFERALHTTPELILTEINLPDISGLDVIRHLKHSPSLQHIPVVVLTADASDEITRKCVAAGAESVLNKPVNRLELLNIIQRIANAAVSKAVHEDNQASALKKVLIADDNPDLRAIFARTFDRRYFSVHIACDGAEAIESLEAELPDVLILDINMPRISGFEVLRYVRENQRTKDVKVVIVTGNYMAVQAPEAEYADLLLVKPVNIADLVTLAQRLIPAQH